MKNEQYKQADKAIFSIIIPTCRRLRQLEDLLFSLASQLRLNRRPEIYQIIVVSDSLGFEFHQREQFQLNEILKFLLPRQRTFVITAEKTEHYSKFLGPGRARNLAVKRADGNILVFLDDDVIPAPGYLQTLKQLDFNNFSAWGGRVLPSRYWREPDSRLNINHLTAELFQPSYFEGTADLMYFPTLNAAVRRDHFDAVGGFDPRFSFAGEDVRLGLMLNQAGYRIGYQPRLAVFHPRPRGFSGRLKSWFRYGTGSRRVVAADIPLTARLAVGPDLNYSERLAYYCGVLAGLIYRRGFWYN